MNFFNDASFSDSEILFDKLSKQGVDSIILGCTKLSLLKGLKQSFSVLVTGFSVDLAQAALKISLPTATAL